MYYLESHSTDPYFNLALEEYLFEHMDRSEQYLMLWQNENTIVVGKYQNTAEEINQTFVEEHRIRVVRRLSGGGAVYHDSGNLNFTFIVDQESAPDFNFKAFIIPVVHVLDDMGIHAAFNGRNDITIDGKKFCGNSQYAKKGRLLHHGCIMLDSNLTDVAAALRTKDAKFESKSVKSVRSRVTTINACAPKPITMERFKALLKDKISEASPLVPLMLTEAQIVEVMRLRDEKYATWEWNYGKSPDYEMHREKKFPAGLVSVSLRAEKGRIRAIRFYGDFFGNGEISTLEQAMEGLPLGPELGEALAPLNIGYYMSGFAADEIYRLLME